MDNFVLHGVAICLGLGTLAVGKQRSCLRARYQMNNGTRNGICTELEGTVLNRRIGGKCLYFLNVEQKDIHASHEGGSRKKDQSTVHVVCEVNKYLKGARIPWTFFPLVFV